MSLSSVNKIFASSLPWNSIRENIEGRKTIHLEHFVGSTHSLFLHKLGKRYDHILAVFPNQESARFLKGDLEALEAPNSFLFPSSGQHPYDDQQITESALAIERSEVLESILQNKAPLTITSAEALCEKIIAPERFSTASLQITTGDTIEPDTLKEKLVDQQYSPVKFVDHRGEFAQRGGILDVFPFSSDYPVRIEFFGDEVDSIREFDPDSQRSISFKKSARFVPDVTYLQNEVHHSLLHYLNDETIIVLFNASLVFTEFEQQFSNAETKYQQIGEEEEVPPPEKRFVSLQDFRTSIDNRTRILFGAFASDIKPDWSFRLDSSPQPDFNGSIKLLKEDIRSLSLQSFDTYLLCDNPGQQERFEELLGESNRRMRYHLSVETLHEGFLLNNKGIAVYTDHQVFNRYHRPKIKRRKITGGISFKELKDLNPGDYVVHVDHGIGVFRGFKKIKVRDVVQESVVLHYKEGSVLYVNVTSLNKIQKYSSKEGMQPRIDKLGSGRWARKKAETKAKVKDIARDLIKLYAKRKSQEAFQFDADNSWQVELEARFEFEETPDQREAIKAVKKDMESDTPMDRLICGDVGFGKTEVAVRAAFKAVMNHKQVAMLAPTTILAEQHYKTFSRRMKEFPVNIEMLSRFRSRSEQKQTLKKLAEGKVDIVIGTHRLASKDVEFSDLGLLVVDEEQRFGVKVKERLKKYRTTVDVLTLTATPIPRTLQFSLMGARDLSIITTPPPNRQPVQTEIHSMDEGLIRDAILQETTRGGQVFFIHNRVKNIQQIAANIRRIIPDIRVRFAHGQMNAHKLENLIEDFYDHKFDVLVSTNIVENGIDIANANTMIINRADNFGLAELHQLRGRVGRSNRKAFCLLITPPTEKLTSEARKRLLALEEFSDLGAGFNLAMRDLDIRGAGDILGAEQSGFINDLGFDMYKKILNDAVQELKQDEFDDVFEDVEARIELPQTQVEMDCPALLESDYVSDNVERLNMYRKLAGADNIQEIDDWQEELQDRFGAIPDAAQNLTKTAKIKLFASQNLFTKVTVRSDRMWLVCPKQDSVLGDEFYNHRFQPLMKILQEQAEDRLEVIQKKNRIRFVISDIPDLHTAVDFLKSIRITEQNDKEPSLETV
jgi:transcription-repair coupling factor (superfamily II helicase)